MKLALFIFSVFLLTANHTFAQTETFDIASFTPPKDWRREVGKEKIAFSVFDTAKGQFCFLILHASRQSSGNFEQDFKDDWKQKIGELLNTEAKPEKITKVKILPTILKQAWEF